MAVTNQKSQDNFVVNNMLREGDIPSLRQSMAAIESNFLTKSVDLEVLLIVTNIKAHTSP